MRKQIGARIKQFRREKNLTQAEIAELVDVTEKHMSQIEQGVSFPSLGVLMDISLFVEKPVEAILYGAGEDRSEQWSYLQMLYSELDSATRTTLVRIAKELWNLNKGGTENR